MEKKSFKTAKEIFHSLKQLDSYLRFHEREFCKDLEKKYETFGKLTTNQYNALSKILYHVEREHEYRSQISL